MKRIFSLCVVFMLSAILYGEIYGESPGSPLYCVFPFENRGQSQEDSWIGEALSDLIALVVESQGEKVSARSERVDAFNSFGFTALSSPTLASQLKIAEHLRGTHLIRGSFYFNGTFLSTECSLIDLRKLVLADRFVITVEINKLLSSNKEICERLFSGDASLLLCKSYPDAVFGEMITVEAYEAFIKAFLADSFAIKEELFLKAISLSPGFERGILELGTLYFNTAHFESAEETLKILIDSKSKRGADACLILGELFIDKGRYDEAIELLKKAISYGGSGKAHFFLSKAYHMNGDAENALQEIEIAVRLDPTDIDARVFKRSLESNKNW